jgi:hypothetical protein
MTGMPVFGSFEFDTFSPASAVPRKPCSGAKIFFTSTPLRTSVSTRCVFPTIDVLFANTATRLDFSIGRYAGILSAAGMIFESPSGGCCNEPDCPHAGNIAENSARRRKSCLCIIILSNGKCAKNSGNHYFRRSSINFFNINK